MKKINYRYLFIVIGAILLSSLGYFYSTGLNDLWFLTWFAPLPMLLFSLYERKIWIVFVAANLSYFLGGMNYLYYLQTVMPVQIVLSTLLGELANSVVFAVIILFMRYTFKKSESWWTILIFPVAWVSFEFLTSCLSVDGTLGNIAYSQLRFLPVIQLASITGIWGISFIITLVPSTLAIAWYLRKKRGQLYIVLGFMTIAVGITLGFGILRLVDSKPIATVKIGLLAAPATIRDLKTTRLKDVIKIVKNYIQEIPKLKKQGAEIIVMPEKLVRTKPFYDQQVVQLFKQAALKNQVMVVFGLNQLLYKEKFNTAFVISKKGKIIVRYYKQHLLPGPETGYFIGNKLGFFGYFQGKFGVAICKDMDFINPALQYAKQGAGVLLVPALDFVVDKWAHSKPAIMRGVEGGFSVVRIGQWGLLLAANKYGYILKRRSTSNQTMIKFVVAVPIYSGKTFYSRYGNWFAWLMFAILIVIFSIMLITRRK